jgi:hypothetical protein
MTWARLGGTGYAIEAIRKLLNLHPRLPPQKIRVNPDEIVTDEPFFPFSLARP